MAVVDQVSGFKGLGLPCNIPLEGSRTSVKEGVLCVADPWVWRV